MISFERVELRKFACETSDGQNGFNIFQTLPWLDFICQTHNATPLILSIKDDSRLLGYFTGLIIKKWGMKILGSPFRGWQTYFMGFNLGLGASRREILLALPKFAFRELGCHYLEIIDPNLAKTERSGTSYKIEPLHWFTIDLSRSEEDLLAAMKSQGRNCIRQSIRRGVEIEEAHSIDFADDFYDQSQDVYDKHSLTLTYDRETIRRMIRLLLPTGNLMLLRARNTEGKCIATGVLLAYNHIAVFWGAASYRQYQNLRPNEPLAWYAIRKMKERGAQVLHFGGLNEQFKRKLGCKEAELCRFMIARNKALDAAFGLVTSPSSLKYKNWLVRQLQHRGA